MKRDLTIGARACCARRARPRPGRARQDGRRRKQRAGAAIRSRSDVAQTAAEPLGARERHRRRRSTRRITSGSFTAARARSTPRKSTRRPNRRSAECCIPAPPVIEFDQQGNVVHAWGGPGRGLRVAGVQPRHHHRLQRHRLDRRQRRQRRPDPEVHARRQVRQAVRVLVRQRRQQRPVGVQQGRQDVSRRAEQRGLRGGWLRQQARRRHRHGHRARSSATGAPTGTSRATRRSAPTIRRRRPRSSSGTPSTAPSCRATTWSTSAIASTIGSRCSRRRASSSRRPSSRRTPAATASVWDIAFSRDAAAEILLPGRRRQREGPGVRSPVVDRTDGVR